MLPIILRDVALFFPHKICFEHVSTVLEPGARVGITGPNGSGKSTLLNMLRGVVPCSEGRIDVPPAVHMAHVPQVVDFDLEKAPEPDDSEDSLSGGQRLYRAIGAALAGDPDVLLLDEPTNHLDARHRVGLLRLLERFRGTLVVVSHDETLLRRMQVLWRLRDGTLTVFPGNLDDCLREERVRRRQLDAEDAALRRERKNVRAALQQEQQRRASSARKGKKKFADDKMQATAARNRAEKNGSERRLRERRDRVDAAGRDLRLPETLNLRFQLCGERERGNVLTITDGSLTYAGAPSPVLQHLFLTLTGGERLAVHGDNGSGKTTLLRGILEDPALERRGFWSTPSLKHIGYLDQHYAVLGDQRRSVLDVLRETLPDWDAAQLRRWLNDFLFRKNEEVFCPISALSGGERARLCLAVLAARAPRLLLLDEVTNNLDVDARSHVIEVLRACPCAMLLVSHDAAFLDAVNVTTALEL